MWVPAQCALNKAPTECMENLCFYSGSRTYQCRLSTYQTSVCTEITQRASFEYWTKAVEITTRQWCLLFWDGNSAPTDRAQLHPSFTTNYPHNGHFLWMKGQDGLGGGVWVLRVGGESRTRGWQCYSELCIIFWSRAGGHRAEACASHTLNADYVTLYTAPPEFRESGSFILWILWMSGLFSGCAERGCFRLFLHTRPERWAFILLTRKPWD